MLLIALGVLFQGDGAPWFYGLLTLTILLLLFVRPAIDTFRDTGRWMRGVAEQRKAKKQAKQNSAGAEVSPQSGPATATT